MKTRFDKEREISEITLTEILNIRYIMSQTKNSMESFTNTMDQSRKRIRASRQGRRMEAFRQWKDKLIRKCKQNIKKSKAHKEKTKSVNPEHRKMSCQRHINTFNEFCPKFPQIKGNSYPSRYKKKAFRITEKTRKETPHII